MKNVIVAFAIVGFFVFTSTAFAGMTSTNYKIQWDSFSTGGSDTSSSSSYGLRDSIGESSIGSMSATNYQITSGYRAGVFDQILTFSLLLQNTSDARVVTSFSSLTISSANTSSISVGDYIALVQDVGVSQVSAIGKVASVSTNTSITVDAWATDGSLPTINGANDYYYPMNASSVAFGSLTNDIVSTGIVAFEISAEDPNGYVVQIQSDSGLTSGSHNITNVSDGSVSGDSEEYGVRSSDTSLANSTFDSADTALSSSYQDITTESTTKFNDRHFVTLKVSKTSNTQSGSYVQTISLIASGNF